MIQILASSNSRYFVLRRNNELSLYRVPARLWSRNVAGLQNIIGVGNRGDVYFRTVTNGLCRYSVDANSDMEIVSWVSVLLAANNGSGKVEKVVLNSDGTNMFAELVMPSQSLSTSWRNFFGPGEKPGSGYDHIIYRVGNTGGKVYSLPRVTTMSAHGEFMWAVSREFTYLVTAELQKRGLYEFLVYRVKRKEVVSTFSLPDCFINNITIDDYGRVSVDIEGQNKRRTLLVRDTSNNTYTIPLEPEAEVLNVWKDRICWQTPHELAIQRFDGELICRVSTEPLNGFGIEYFFLFNHNNDINLAMSKEDEQLIITPVDPDNLANDAKRWRRVSELKKESEMLAEEKARQEIEKEEAKKQRYQKMRIQLGDTLNDIKSKRQREQLEQKQNSSESGELPAVSLEKTPEEPASEQVNPYNAYNPYPPMVDLVKPSDSAPAKLARTQAIIINDIKVLRERYAAGAIGQEDYMKSLDRLNDELLSQHS
ncbi:MAG: hypothetical protein Q4F00_12240 [bacterium]|nr:hypothetical protein [bacterium]